jgi:hypothetical protein
VSDIRNSIQEIYIGLLGRAANYEGLSYWENEIQQGLLTLEQLRANIVNQQPEYTNGLGQLDRLHLVAELYARLFSRYPLSEGLDYWVSGGGSGVDADQLVLALIDGASSEDREVLDAKVAAAQDYTYLAFNDYDRDQATATVETVGGTAEMIFVEDDTPDDGLSIPENLVKALVGDVTVIELDSSVQEINVDDERFEVVEGQLKLKDGHFLNAESEESVSLNLTVIYENEETAQRQIEVVVEDLDDTVDVGNISFNPDPPWQVGTATSVGDINGDGVDDTGLIARSHLSPYPTTISRVSLNLDAGESAPTDSDGYNFQVDQNIFDSLGNKHTMSLYFTRAQEDSSAPEAALNIWNLVVRIDGYDVGNPKGPGEDASEASFTLQFDEHGELTTETDATLLITNWAPRDSSGQYNGSLMGDIDATSPPVVFPYLTSSNFVIDLAGTTQYDEFFSIKDTYQNGGLGSLSNGNHLYLLFGDVEIEDGAFVLPQLDGEQGTLLKQHTLDSQEELFYGDRFEYAPSGDPNGDGIQDLFIVPETIPYDVGVPDPSDYQFYLIYGRTGTWEPEIALDSLGERGSVFFDSGSPDANWSVTTVGDVNGDGLDDFSATDPAGGSNAYLIFGKSNGFEEQVDLAYFSQEEAVQFTDVEALIQSAGDVNNDGFDDMLMIDITGAAHLVYGAEDFF